MIKRKEREEMNKAGKEQVKEEKEEEIEEEKLNIGHLNVIIVSISETL